MYTRATVLSRGSKVSHAYNADARRTVCGIGKEAMIQGKMRPTGLLSTQAPVLPDRPELYVDCKRCINSLRAGRSGR